MQYKSKDLSEMNSCNAPQISYQHDSTDVSRNNVQSKMKPNTLL